jgi:hypothetical protein
MEYRPRVKTKVLVTVSPCTVGPSQWHAQFRSARGSAKDSRRRSRSPNASAQLRRRRRSNRSAARYKELGGSRLKRRTEYSACPCAADIAADRLDRVRRPFKLITMSSTSVVTCSGCAGPASCPAAVGRRRRESRRRRPGGRRTCSRCTGERRIGVRRRRRARGLRQRVPKCAGGASTRRSTTRPLRSQRIIAHPCFVVEVQDRGERDPEQHSGVRH